MKIVAKKCNCYPSYDSQFIRMNGVAACNFFEHASCLATIRNKFEQIDIANHCLPSCDHTTVNQESIHVSYKDIAADSAVLITVFSVH